MIIPPHWRSILSPRSMAEALTDGWRNARREGAVRAVEFGLAALRDLRDCRQFLRASAQLPASSSILQAVDLVFSHPSVTPWQLRSEILGLTQLIESQRPRTVLEIGTARGGTLFLFSRCAAMNATIISVDLPRGPFGGGYAAWREGFYRSFIRPGQTLHLVRADSHSRSTVEKVLSALGEQRLDFLFIDGDHSYQGVKSDFLTYSPLVASGGCVAFHDIVRSQPAQGGEVASFWEEIRRSFRTTEVVESSNQGAYGIGVINM